MRLAEGQIRCLVAHRSRRLVRDDGRSGQRKIRTPHASHAANEEIEPGSAASSVCRDLISEFESTGTIAPKTVSRIRGLPRPLDPPYRVRRRRDSLTHRGIRRGETGNGEEIWRRIRGWALPADAPPLRPVDEASAAKIPG